MSEASSKSIHFLNDTQRYRHAKFKYQLDDVVNLPLKNLYVEYNNNMYPHGSGILYDYPIIVQMMYNNGVLDGELFVADVAKHEFLGIYIVKNSKVAQIIDLSLAVNMILDLDNDGTRWEGPIIDTYMCGWGTIFDSENDVHYTGFCFDTKKVCYGTEYHPGCQELTMYYQGTLANGRRFGIGALFDRTGKCATRGEWINNSNTQSRDITISADNSNLPTFHSLIEKVHFLRMSGSTLHTVSFVSLWMLQEIIVESHCMPSVSSPLVMELRDLPSLRTFSIGNHSCSMYNVCTFSSCLFRVD